MYLINNFNNGKKLNKFNTPKIKNKKKKNINETVIFLLNIINSKNNIEIIIKIIEKI